MPQYIVMMIPAGQVVPPEDQPGNIQFMLHTAADAASARAAVAPLMHPLAGQQVWVTDTANLGAPTQTAINYGFS